MFNLFQSKPTSYKNIQCQELENKISENKGSTLGLIDVRTKMEFEDGHIPGSVNIDLYDPSFQKKLDALDKDKTYYVYCRSGNRSAHACNMMAKHGFKDLYNLKGGMIYWSGPVE